MIARRCIKHPAVWGYPNSQLDAHKKVGEPCLGHIVKPQFAPQICSILDVTAHFESVREMSPGASRRASRRLRAGNDVWVYRKMVI